MNKIVAHSELHTSISLYSSWQFCFSNSPALIIVSPLPLKAINFVIITTQTTACLLCICWTWSSEQLCSVHLAKDFTSTATKTAEFPFTHCERYSGRDVTFQNQNSGPSFLSGATVERVCASFLRGLKILALCCGFVYTRVENIQCTAVLCRSAQNTEQSVSFLVDF